MNCCFDHGQPYCENRRHFGRILGSLRKDRLARAAAAEQAVRADPIDPRSKALMGAGQLTDRKAVQADRSFRVAARFGWRDPLTQLYFMNAGFAAG